MGIWFTIAFRNIVKNGKRSLLIGIAIFISTAFLLLADSLGNGGGAQLVAKYRASTTGDAVVVWKEVKKYDAADPSRLFYSAFDQKQEASNREALGRFNKFLRAHADKIRAVYNSIKAPGTLDTGEYTEWIIVTGIEPQEYDFLRQEKVLELEGGESPFSREYGICISSRMADKYAIPIGAWLSIDSTTKDGYTNTYDYEVTGVYTSSSDFDSTYVYMSRQNALELLDWEPQYFSTSRIFLKDPGQSQQFALSLDQYLTESSDVLRAESFEYAAKFFTLISGAEKGIVTAFVLFLLFVIALGIRSTVRMNLFERLAEFGTLRAMGFDRARMFLIVFLEIFLLSLVACGAAILFSMILVTVLGITGIYTGSDTMAIALGGSYVYPVLYPLDVIVAFLAITLFSVFAALKPGLRLCYQKITDLLAQDQKSLFATAQIIKRLFAPRARVHSQARA
jgi:putative ABC transport system permease protein